MHFRRRLSLPMNYIPHTTLSTWLDCVIMHGRKKYCLLMGLFNFVISRPDGNYHRVGIQGNLVYY